MLSQEFFARAAAAAAMLGLLALFLFSQQNAAEKTISGLSEGEESLVLLKGRVESAWQSNGALFFELNDGNKIKAVLFNPDSKQASAVRKNFFVEVVGKTQKYRGETEIIVLSVKKVD